MARQQRSPQELFDAARSGDRAAMARLLSLIERGLPPSSQQARDLRRFYLGGEAA